MRTDEFDGHGGRALQRRRELMDKVISLFAWRDLVSIVLLKRVTTVAVNRANIGSQCSSLVTSASSIQVSSCANQSLLTPVSWLGFKVLSMPWVFLLSVEAVTSLQQQACACRSMVVQRGRWPPHWALVAYAASPSFNERRGCGGREIVCGDDTAARLAAEPTTDPDDRTSGRLRPRGSAWCAKMHPAFQVM